MRNGGPKQAQLAALTFALLLKTPGCSVRLPAVLGAAIRLVPKTCCPASTQARCRVHGGRTSGHDHHVTAQVFSLFDAITCGSFLKVLSDAHRQPSSARRSAVRDAGSDADMDDADADGAAAAASDARIGGDSEWCVDAVAAFADVLPLLSLKDQQDTLRR